MDLSRKVLWAFVIWLPLQYNSAGKFVIYKAKNLECTTNKDYFVNVTCTLVAVDWLNSYINADADLVQPLNKLVIRASFFGRDNANQFKPYLYPFDINLCTNDEKYLLIPYAKLIVNHLRTHTNFNHTCPYEGHILARQLLNDGDFLPDFALGEYRMKFKVFTDTSWIGTIQFSLEAMQRRKLRRRIKGNKTTVT